MEEEKEGGERLLNHFPPPPDRPLKMPPIIPVLGLIKASGVIRENGGSSFSFLHLNKPLSLRLNCHRHTSPYPLKYGALQRLTASQGVKLCYYTLNM